MAIDILPRGFSETACWDCGKEVTPLEAAHVASVTGKNRVECRACAGAKLLDLSRSNARTSVRLAVLAAALAFVSVALVVWKYV